LFIDHSVKDLMEFLVI